MTNNLDQVTLVDEHDEVLGSMDKIEAHRGEGKLHRAISTYLFRPSLEGRTSSPTTGGHDKRGVELLIQQRSVKKIVGANMWANTVCGNVRPTESYEECAYRRLKEELGIQKNLLPSSEGRMSSSTTGELLLQPIHKFQYHLQCNEEFSEFEMDQVYVGWYDDKVTPNPDEAQNYKWVNWAELQEKASLAELKKDQFNTKEITINNQSLTLAPWFVWMLGDEKLQIKLDEFIKN